ncbi:hypothetical protein [Rhodovulum sulfidophilum]|uniref:hypothetical protein n=1 Tax=Rhodovulum sulfidophilum TaxID=35806 RepID=UPI0005AB3CA4|nr:hypothetical protein [Rhodovulum sulfidophilum]ANB36335.1 hypothetical protein A6W98_19430 [Rhodovulum sulfidophilum DSM 1374]ANB40137.1 hypothetical protein A6024_19190 [Rhodovulum sulfidophilum]MBL3551531.1 hypothetical protein [Rhodovulum sulfidophilum]MCW2304728.1 hypothetical protein [Rhodovulum sulfidophilum]NDK35764.1 hypothetical protein [Rhodovulum sulfidophilum]
MALALPKTMKKAVHIIGILCAAAAGLALIIHGALITSAPMEIAWGAIFLAGSLLAVLGGATASPRGGIDPPSPGAKFTRIADWAWYCIAALVVVGIVLSFVI